MPDRKVRGLFLFCDPAPGTHSDELSYTGGNFLALQVYTDHIILVISKQKMNFDKLPSVDEVFAGLKSLLRNIVYSQWKI